MEATLEQIPRAGQLELTIQLSAEEKAARYASPSYKLNHRTV